MFQSFKKENLSFSDLESLSGLLNQISLGHLAFTSDLLVSHWNRTLEKMTGLRSNQTLGQHIFQVLPHILRTPEEAYFLQSLQGLENTQKEINFAIPTTQKKGVYEASYFPVRSADRSIVGGMAIFRDITSQKWTEENLQEIEGRFRLMADCSPVLLWMSGADSECTFFNQTWLDFTGRTLEEEMGVGWGEGIHFEDFQSAMDTYLDAFNHRSSFEMEYRLRRKDGEFRWILDRGTPRFGHDGVFLGFIGSCIDITERKNWEKAQLEYLRTIQEAQENFQDLYEKAPDMFLSIKADTGMILQCNQTFADTFQIEKEEILRRSFFDFCLPEYVEKAKELFQIKDGRFIDSHDSHWENDLQLHHPLKGKLHIGLKNSGVMGENGELLYCRSVLRDITDRKLLEDKLFKMVQDREDFLSIAGHELKTPLTSLKLQLQMMEKSLRQKPDRNEDFLRRLAIAGRQVRKLTYLIETLISVTLLKKDLLPMTFEETDLSQIVHKTLERMKEENAQDFEGTPLILNLVEGSTGLWDSHTMGMVVEKILYNALKYGRHRPIEIEVSSNGTEAVFKVKDQGIGISDEDQERIFLEFERAVSSRHYGGLGLGLYMVREIVEAHQGKIKVQSLPGTGTTFIVTLPRERTPCFAPDLAKSSAFSSLSPPSSPI